CKRNAVEAGVKCTFRVGDFVEQSVTGGPFDFIYDRGCFHVFEPFEERNDFARNAAAHLKPDGLWFSIIGNSNDPPRKHGPPMLPASDIALSVEPYFEILSLRAGQFSSEGEVPPRAWLCLMRNRTK
ncbi:MAG: methyltransferase domain-containing protein, partial [bacterium]|nr:methyltransferase domain-containing protein [bacterium]